jgi:hypothetical protein
MPCVVLSRFSLRLWNKLSPGQQQSFFHCFFFSSFQEEDYEWGNPAKGFIPLDNGSVEAKLATAARRTRQGIIPLSTFSNIPVPYLKSYRQNTSLPRNFLPL